MLIREAKLSDAEGIAKVHVDCWRTTYKNIIPDSYLDSLTYDKRTPLWINNISRTDNNVFVAESNEGEIVGFADGGRRETNDVENSGDLTSIYILEKYQAKGIGNKLVEKLFSTFNELGYNKVFVEVLEDNKSRFFYEKMGAKLYKSTTTEIQGKELNLLIYEWQSLSSLHLTDKKKTS